MFSLTLISIDIGNCRTQNKFDGVNTTNCPLLVKKYQNRVGLDLFFMFQSHFAII